MKPNFMNDSIRTFIHTKQLNTHTHTQPEQLNCAVFMLKLGNKLAYFLDFIHYKLCAFHQSQKCVLSLLSNFLYFMHPYMNPLLYLLRKNSSSVDIFLLNKFPHRKRSFSEKVTALKNYLVISFALEN